MWLLRKFAACLLALVCAGVAYSADPGRHGRGAKVTYNLPDLVKLGEIFNAEVNVVNLLNRTVLAVVSFDNRTQNGCLLPKHSADFSFRMQPRGVGTIFAKLGVELKYQRTHMCEERSKDSDETLVLLKNITVEAEGFRREQTTTKYVCGSDAPEGLGARENRLLQEPPEAIEGSVSAWLTASTTYMGFAIENMERLLPHGRGDLDSLFEATNEYFFEALLYEETEADVMKSFFHNIEKAYEHQLQYRLEDNSYTTLGSRNRSASSWMTAYILTIGTVSFNFSVMRKTWSWQAGLQRSEESADGCFDSVGKLFDDELKNNVSKKESRVLLTAYKMIAVGISGMGGPPHLEPFRARDCLVQHSSKDPFFLAIKAYAIAVVQLPETKMMLKELLLQAVETEKYIYWDLPDDDTGTKIKEIRIASYAALAIIRYSYDTFKHELSKISRWLVEQMNSHGGFYSIFDTMMAVRSLLFFDTRPIEHDVSVAVMATGWNGTLHFNKEHRFKVQGVPLPVLPTNVSYTVTGSSCAIVQTAVQYNVQEHYQSSAFTLEVTGHWNPSFVCNRPHHISVCVASPHLGNRTSNLVAVEVTLVSGFVPQKKDLKEIVRPSLSVFTQYRYEEKRNKVIFFADGLTAKESCLEFKVHRLIDFEVAKAGVVVVYDYYHPEIAVSKSYSLTSSSKCSSVQQAISAYRGNAASEGGGDASRDPFSVAVALPSHAKRGEVLPVRITAENHLDQVLHVTFMLDNTTQYEIVEDVNQMTSTTAGERSACLGARGATTAAFKIRPLVAEVVNITVGVAVTRQNTSSCEGGDWHVSDYIYVSLLNITVESDGFTREKTWGKYACGPDIQSGRDTLQDWRVEAPPEAVQGSARAWLTAASNFMAVIEQNTHRSLLLHDRGDVEGLTAAANQYLYLNFLGSMRYRNETYDDILSNVKEGNRRQLSYRLEDDSYAIFGSRTKEVSSWMTSYILTIAALTSERGITRPTWNWLNTLQRDADNEDGCFDHVGKVYHNGLRNETTGNVSRVLLTAYTMVSLGISAWDGPPHIDPFKARDCILQHKSADPFTLAIKAHALGVTHFEEKYGVLTELFKLATETEDYIYWDIPNDKYGTNSEAVQTASYVAMAIMTTDYDRKFEAELNKVIRWLAAQANSRGGFNSIFDTMMGVRALLYYERRAFEFDVEAKVMAEGVDRTLTFTIDNFRQIQRVDFPVLPANVQLDVSGSGCAFLQAVVQYSVNDHYNSEDFSLAVSSSADANVCGASRINVCTSYLPNRQSNLIAVEVALVSGYTPFKDDLEALVSSGNGAFTEYEIKGNKVVLYMASLSAEEACADFGVVRELEVEEAKPGVVVVYDYYQPEIAKSKSYTISSANACTRN